VHTGGRPSALAGMDRQAIPSLPSLHRCNGFVAWHVDCLATHELTARGHLMPLWGRVAAAPLMPSALPGQGRGVANE
jgi:hypothetical protein